MVHQLSSSATTAAGFRDELIKDLDRRIAENAHRAGGIIRGRKPLEAENLILRKLRVYYAQLLVQGKPFEGGHEAPEPPQPPQSTDPAVQQPTAAVQPTAPVVSTEPVPQPPQNPAFPPTAAPLPGVAPSEPTRF